MASSMPRVGCVEHLDPLRGEGLELRSGLKLQVIHCNGAAPALVYLHGALGNRFNWRSQIEHSVSTGQECLAYDLAGHGQSSAYTRYSIGRHSRDLMRLLDYFNIKTPVLVAHSYGVPIALECASSRAMAGLVLVAGGTHNLDPWWERPLMRLMRFGGRQVFRSDWVQGLSRMCMSHRDQASVVRFCHDSPTPFELEPYRSIEAFWGYKHEPSSAAIELLNIPALVLTGGRDPVFTYAMGEALAGCFQRGRHLHLADCGHLLMAEEPDAVNLAIEQWILDEHLNQADRR